jgi:citrate lyase subunit beta/citryl-CoA lyase
VATSIKHVIFLESLIMPAPHARPRRSVLYMPGANPKALEKAKSLAADAVILDLEDAVAPDAKVQARDEVVRALAAGGYGKREVIVRVNALTSVWGASDLQAVLSAKPDAILFPKISSAEEVNAASEAMDALGAPADIGLWAMIETPLAILDIKAIAEASKSTRLCAFVMGTNDIAKETRARQTADRAPFWFALSATVTAARLYGLAVIDGVYNDIGDSEGFARICEQGLDFGFDGKTLIHPSQIESCNQIFAPTQDALAHASAIIAAFDAPENAGKGVLKVDGKMAELLHRDMARQTVAIGEAIAAMSN